MTGRVGVRRIVICCSYNYHVVNTEERSRITIISLIIAIPPVILRSWFSNFETFISCCNTNNSSNPDIRDITNKIALDYAMELPINSKIRRSSALSRLRRLTSANIGQGIKSKPSDGID